jgi:hypothetical protein
LIRKPAALHVPGIRAGEAAFPDDPCHFGNPFRRIRDKEDDQRHDSDIKDVVGKGQRHGVALMERCGLLREACPGKEQLRFRRVDSVDRPGRTALGDQRGEGAVAAPHIEPPLVRWRRQPAKKRLAGGPAPLSHVLLVAGAILESYLAGCHSVSLCNRQQLVNRVLSCHTPAISPL